MENVVKNYKGVVLFYIIIALLAFVCSWRLNSLNIISQEKENVVEKNYCA